MAQDLHEVDKLALIDANTVKGKAILNVLLYLYQKRIATTDEIAKETGLEYWRVYEALRKLEEAGYVRKGKAIGNGNRLIFRLVANELPKVYVKGKITTVEKILEKIEGRSDEG